ncbi:hypothetical protein AQUCO_02700356v1 [Aquilegia coerulea]|uniref:Ubiquitin-like domain-containing protein n=1 Tax=Aquilegia coerulea TaxID=218851 RepID=A0A2G5D6H1_AQUCA|nr:hypothetical protein AQUCO_02700356v1 [Aquilegia coerulea]
MYRKLPNHRVEVHIEIRPGVGVNQQSLALSITTDYSIARLKTEIHQYIGVPPQNQFLTTKGITMEDNHTLGEYMVELNYQFIVLERVEVDAQNNEVAAAQANN